ncbi:isochorismatase family protein [Planctomycetota bacterium]|nr:isochorismatase family protein [Planctomycetota bacterium]
MKGFLVEVKKFVIEETALIVVDLQEKLLPAMHDNPRIIERSSVMIRCAKEIGMPIIATQQYPQGLGQTVDVIKQLFDENDSVYDKTKFSACTDEVMKDLDDKGVKSVLILGVEAHVCVMQSCLDLKLAGYNVGVIVDAIGSRNPIEWDTSIARMQQNDVTIMTVESSVFELVGDAKSENFKKVRPLVM